MITVTLTINITELDARKLWEPPEDAADDAQPPTGQALADAIAEYARTTLVSNWQWDNGFSPPPVAAAATDTLALLRRLKVIDETLAAADPESPEIPALLEHGEAIALKLTGSHLPEEHQTQLAELRALYAAELAVTAELEAVA